MLTPFEAENDEYDFSCELKLEEDIELSNLEFNVDFQLKNEKLSMLIQEEKAIFALHLECASTMKRLLFTTTKKQDCFEVNTEDLNKSVDINFLILANTDIFDYTNIEVDPFSEGFSFELVKGDLLAIGPPETLDIEKEPIIERDSIFEIMPISNKKAKPLMVELNSNKIGIYIPKKNFETMSFLHESTLSKADTVLVAIYYTPAMVEALYYVRDIYNENDETEIDAIRDMSWFRSIRARLHHIGVDIEQLPDDNIIGIVHEMLEDPNQKAMKYILEEFSGGEYET